MITRTSRLLALAAVLTSQPLLFDLAHADGSKQFKIRFAGGFLQNVEQAQVSDGTPNGATQLRSMAFIKGRGTFGRTDIMAVTVSGPAESDTPCPAGLVKIADIVENNLILTFNDLSLLFGNGTGVVCLDPANPAAYPQAEIDGTWEGGTGRFEGAGGDWSIRFDFAERVGLHPDDSPDTQFVAETGMLQGHLTRARGDD